MATQQIILSKLKIEDVPRMVDWGKHYDPCFYHYNFDITTEYGFEFWYKSKKRIFQRKIYKIENLENIMVGFITIKNINWATKTAEMGIVFDPNNLCSGYGSAGMYQIFKEFFVNQNMNRLYLRVAGFNKRAHHTYKKVGFVEYKRVEEPFENQQINSLLVSQNEDLYLIDDILYSEYIYMEITKTMYFERKNKCFSHEQG